MPQIKEFYHDVDLKANQLFNSRLHNITTALRITLGASLSSVHKGYMVYDTDLLLLFLWDGVQWQQAGGTGLPSQAGNNGKWLKTDGTNASWADLPSPPTPPQGVTVVTATSPLFSSGGFTPDISIQQSSSSQAGYLSSSDWTTFNSKEPAITAGTTSQYWRGDKTWQTFPTIGTWGALNYPSWNSGTPFVKMTAAGTFSLDTNTYLTSAVTSIATSGLISGGTITSSGTISTSMNTNKLVGRSTAGAGVMEEITVGSGLSLSGGTLSASVSGGILKGITSGTDTYTTTITGPISYTDGDAYLIRFVNGNTTGATLNINGLGAKTLYRNNDGSLIGGDIISGAEMICVFNSTLDGFQTIGTAPNTLLGYVTNDDSVTITKGQVVYAFGGQGDRMTVKLANNTADATSARTVGLVMSTSIAPNQKGFIMLQGLLSGLSILPTATWSDGDPVYLGATNGSITNVKPYAPNHLVYIGVVTTASNGSSGRLYVKVQNGYELEEIHDVDLISVAPVNNNVLTYVTGSPDLWKPRSISTILGYTPQAQLNGTGFVKASGTTISYDNSTYLTSVGTGVTNELTYWSGTNTIGSLSTSTYPSLTELSYVKGVTSAIQTQLDSKLPLSSYEWMWATGFQALGSTIKGINLGLPVFYSVGAAAVLTNGAVRFVPYYLANAATITGVKFYQANTASYTGNNYNGVGLYSYSGGTLTLVASSTNSASFWINTINTWVSKPFSSPYSAPAGVYYIGMMFSASSAPTPPQTLAGSTVNVGFATVDFTNSAKIAGVSNTGLTALPSPTIAMSSINSTTNVPSIYLY